MFTFAATDVLTSNIELSVFLLLDLFLRCSYKQLELESNSFAALTDSQPASRVGAEWSRSRGEGGFKLFRALLKHCATCCCCRSSAVCSWPAPIYLGSLV